MNTSSKLDWCVMQCPETRTWLAWYYTVNPLAGDCGMSEAIATGRSRWRWLARLLAWCNLWLGVTQ